MKKIVLLLMAVILCLSSSAQKVYKVYQDCSRTFNEDLTQPTGTENGHEWVDLGLSVKWATINVGATSDCEYGPYIAYINSNYYNISIIPLSLDFARHWWGGKWRIPSRGEIMELIDNCTCTPIICQNNIQGVKFTSKINGNSIFMAYSGYCTPSWSTFDQQFYERGTVGYFPTNTFYTNNMEAGDDAYDENKITSYMLKIQVGGATIVTKNWRPSNSVVQYNFTIRAVCD